MKAIPLAIPEVILFEPKVFGVDRGFFYESVAPAQGRSMALNDHIIEIDWPLQNAPTPSTKDQAAVSLQNAEVFV